MSDFDYKKSLGQNFLKDNNIISKIIKYSDIHEDTLVIEIGPGAGSLSKQIMPLCGRAILFEIDVRLKDILEKELCIYSNYDLIFGDFLEQNVKNIISNYDYSKLYVVANLPYYITTPIITKLTNEIYPDRIVIMVQDEVANRLSAHHGNRDYGMISVLLSAKYNVKKLFKVSRKCFEPVPNVDSAVLLLEKCDKMQNINYSKFEKLIKSAFQFKRKNLKNNLNNYNLDEIDKVLKQHNFSLTDRAEDIPAEVFIDIARKI